MCHLNFLGAAKFAIEKFISVVIDSSGAEIDEDEVLEQLPSGEVLTLLQTDEQWIPPPQSVSSDQFTVYL